MARIRSIHPGLASDESYMSMSIAAKAAWPLLWMECDDKGVFEWKPIVLKARIFPADNVNFADLLSEWEGLNCVRQFTVDGKTYGAVRNFRKFQRPKTPNDIHPAPAEIRNYLGLTNDVSETDGVKADPLPPNGEKSPQMEDVGGKMKEEGGRERTTQPVQPSARTFKPPEPVASSPAALRSQELETKLRKAAGWESHPSPKLFITGPIEQLIETGASLERDVLPVISAMAPKVGKPNWNFFIDPIREAMARRVSAGRPLDDKTEADRAAKKAAAAKYLEELSAGGPHGNG